MFASKEKLKQKMIKEYTDDELKDELLFRRYGIPVKVAQSDYVKKRKYSELEVELAMEKEYQYLRKHYDDLIAIIEWRTRNHFIVMQEKSDEDKVKILQSFRKLVSLDVTYSYMAEYVYSVDPRSEEHGLLPSFYYDENGEKKIIQFKKETIDLKDTYLIDCPYNEYKWIRHLFRDSALDPEKCTEDIAYYYPTLNITIRGNGNVHRMAEAYLNREVALAPVRYMEDEELFKHVYSDGAQWKSVHDDKVITDVADYRYAVIFELRKREIELLNKISITDTV